MCLFNVIGLIKGRMSLIFDQIYDYSKKRTKPAYVIIAPKINNTLHTRRGISKTAHLFTTVLLLQSYLVPEKRR
jgi:hypothetical protein